MSTRKTNFTIPEETLEKLKELVAERQRSAFVAAALEEKLADLEKERLMEELAAEYAELREEDAALNAEWEPATLESWPDYD